MIPPFIVLALPRSRTYWLSQWLGCGHDLALAPQVDSVQGWLNRLWLRPGTVETGAAEGIAAMRQALPGARIVTIRRDIDEVEASLAQKGLIGSGLRAQLETQNQFLNLAETQFGATPVDFWQLGDVNCCCWLWEHLLRSPFDFVRWQQFSDINLQLDWPKRLGALREAEDRIAALRDDLAQHTAGRRYVRLGQETLLSMKDEGLPLTEAHFHEANADLPPWYKFDPAIGLWEKLYADGQLRIWTARVNSRLVAYVMFSLVLDPEAQNVMIADQGPIYADPGEGKLGLRLLNMAIAELKAAGIRAFQLHHPMTGRGAKLGPVFERLGASLAQKRYTLFVNEDLEDAGLAPGEANAQC